MAHEQHENHDPEQDARVKEEAPTQAGYEEHVFESHGTGIVAGICDMLQDTTKAVVGVVKDTAGALHELGQEIEDASDAPEQELKAPETGLEERRSRADEAWERIIKFREERERDLDRGRGR